jgi:hypothetical protein
MSEHERSRTTDASPTSPESDADHTEGRAKLRLAQDEPEDDTEGHVRPPMRPVDQIP